MKWIIALLLSVSFFLSCGSSSDDNHPAEFPVTQIVLAGDIASPDAELSGMCWAGDRLILLPQYPDLFTETDAEGSLFYLVKNDIHAFLNGERSEVTPDKIPLFYQGETAIIAGFEGFESICIQGNTVFLTIESSGGGMMGRLIKGTIAEDFSRIDLDTNKIAVILPQSDIDNASDETMVILGDRIYTIYEGNGRNVTPAPVAHVFDFDLNLLKKIPFPNIEYRITDATDCAADQSFWVINYLWPGDAGAYRPAADLIALKNGKGETHLASPAVERLVKMRIDPDAVRIVDEPPVQLVLGTVSNNWEGIVRLDDSGFLICTDAYPGTLLGYVEFVD